MDLKQFIDENRETFDSEEPRDDLFKKIQGQLPGTVIKKKSTWRPLRWVAAASIVLVSAASFYFLGRNKKPMSEVEDPIITTQDMNEIAGPQYAKQIYHFQELIGLKQKELQQLQKDYPDLYRQFISDIQQLDSSYQALKTNLPANPNREMLLEAMIGNLQLQTELLNRQLLIIKEIKQKSNSHEKEKSTI